MTTLTEVFWVTFVTTVTAMLIKLASMCYKSKCREVTFCCFKIVRDTASETQEEGLRIEHQVPSSPSMARNESSREMSAV